MDVGKYEIRVMPVYERAYTWESQVVQYSRIGLPGRISHYSGRVASHDVPVDCLVWRDEMGKVRGILNYYSVDFPPWEQAGNVNVWVDPAWQRRGIGLALVKRCVEMYGPLKVEQQNYSRTGVRLLKKLLREGVVQ